MENLNRPNEDLLDRGANGEPRTEQSTLRADAVRDDIRRDDGNAGDEIGEAVGGISGVLTGAAIGSLGGPIGTIIGGVAGAVSGWWAGRAISEAASHVTTDDEKYYREHYESSDTRLADRSYDDVRPAYQLGHLAGRNPDYQTRAFDEVEGDLQRGWSGDVATRHGSWDQVRDYARHGYDRGRTGFGTGAVAGAAAGVAAGASNLGHRAANAVDDMKDRVDGNPASRPGLDSTDRAGYAAGTSGMSSGSSMSSTADRAWDNTKDAADRLGDKAENAWDRTKQGAENAWDKTKQGAENLGHRAADALDDTKDRVDGNPASRPGPDATDRPDRQF